MLACTLMWIRHGHCILSYTLIWDNPHPVHSTISECTAQQTVKLTLHTIKHAVLSVMQQQIISIYNHLLCLSHISAKQLCSLRHSPSNPPIALQPNVAGAPQNFPLQMQHINHMQQLSGACSPLSHDFAHNTTATDPSSFSCVHINHSHLHPSFLLLNR